MPHFDCFIDRDKVEAELCNKEALEFVATEKKKLAAPVPPSMQASTSTSTVAESSAAPSHSESPQNLPKEAPSPVKKTKMQQDLLELTLSPSIPHRSHHPRPVFNLPELNKPGELEPSRPKELSDNGSSEKNKAEEGPHRPPEDRNEASKSQEVDESNSVENLVQRGQLSVCFINLDLSNHCFVAYLLS